MRRYSTGDTIQIIPLGAHSKCTCKVVEAEIVPNALECTYKLKDRFGNTLWVSGKDLLNWSTTLIKE